MIKRFIGAALAVFLFAGLSHGQLLVDVQLGQLSAGNTNLSGNTTMFGSETDYYALTNPAVNWGNELVYEFSLAGGTGLFSLNVMRNSVTGDPDFFILNDLMTVDDGTGKIVAPGNLGNFFLDANDGEIGATVAVGPGTYYLSASTFAGADGATTMDQATFDIDLIVEEVAPPTPPANPIDLGVIADVNVPFNIDTFGSSFDTELGLYDIGGTLVATNDDEPGGSLDSEIVLGTGLAQGTYFLAAGEFDVTYNFGFDATSTGLTGGDYNLNFNGTSRMEFLNPGGIQFFVFEIGAAGSGFVPPASFTNFRGISITSAVTDFADSDDVDASYNPGFVLNDTEAPVWLIFDGVAADATAFRVESDAGTPGLEYTVEAFNWTTNAFEVVGTEIESFNADTISETAIVPADHIEAGTGNVRSRVGWRQFGFIINFPWRINVDQAGWAQ